MTQLPAHRMPDHRIADGLGNDETDARPPGTGDLRVGGVTAGYGGVEIMQDDGPATEPAAPAHRDGEISGTVQLVLRGEQGLGDRCYAVRRARPLLRRAATTARPERVRMRVRKPCTRARRRLFGWNVRLDTVDTPRFSGARLTPVAHRRPGRLFSTPEVEHPIDSEAPPPGPLGARPGIGPRADAVNTSAIPGESGVADMTDPIRVRGAGGTRQIRAPSIPPARLRRHAGRPVAMLNGPHESTTTRDTNTVDNFRHTSHTRPGNMEDKCRSWPHTLPGGPGPGPCG